MTRRRIIAAGMVRSGTTWLGQGLALAPGFTYYFEPDSPGTNPEAPAEFRHLYVPPDGDDPTYRRVITRALDGALTDWNVLQFSPGPLVSRLPWRWRPLAARFPALYLRQPDVLLKLVYSNLSLGWLLRRFEDVRALYIVRHPCGQGASRRKKGWEPYDIEALLTSEALVRDHLHPFVDRLREARTFWQRAGAYWGAVNYVVERHRQANPNLAIVSFEWLCSDPPAHFREVYHHLGLRWTPKVDAFLRDSADTAGQSPLPEAIRRDPRHEITKWKSELSAGEVAECREFAEMFGLPCYPNFEPEPFEPSWRCNTSRSVAV